MLLIVCHYVSGPVCDWLSVVNQSVVSGVTTTYNREQLWLANESLIAKLQAGCRGYLVRKGLKERKDFLKSQDPAITTIQVRGQTLPFLWTWSESQYFLDSSSFLLLKVHWSRRLEIPPLGSSPPMRFEEVARGREQSRKYN